MSSFKVLCVIFLISMTGKLIFHIIAFDWKPEKGYITCSVDIIFSGPTPFATVLYFHGQNNSVLMNRQDFIAPYV